MTPFLYIFLACGAIDGDTLRCGTERVRLTGIDAPERHEQGYAEAKNRLATLVDGHEVFCVVKARDRYGRLLGDCATDGTRSLSGEMLASGLAAPYR